MTSSQLGSRHGGYYPLMIPAPLYGAVWALSRPSRLGPLQSMHPGFCSIFWRSGTLFLVFCTNPANNFDPNLASLMLSRPDIWYRRLLSHCWTLPLPKMMRKRRGMISPKQHLFLQTGNQQLSSQVWIKLLQKSGRVPTLYVPIFLDQNFHSYIFACVAK